MKKLLIAVALSASFIACNSGNKESNEDKAVSDSIEAGENISSEAQQSSVDTNVNKIGTNNTVADSTAKDRLKK